MPSVAPSVVGRRHAHAYMLAARATGAHRFWGAPQVLGFHFDHVHCCLVSCLKDAGRSFCAAYTRGRDLADCCIVWRPCRSRCMALCRERWGCRNSEGLC